MANDMFLKVDGAEGSSTDSKHKGWIDIESYSFGGSQASTQYSGGGAGSGRVSFQDFHFTAKAGKESPVMFGFMCKGQHIKKVQLQQQKAGGKAMIFLDILLEECFMTSVVMGDSTGGDQPQVQYSLNFTKNTFIYTPQKNDGSPDGPVTQTWNSKENKD